MDSESRGEWSWPLSLRVQLRCRRCSLGVPPTPKEEKHDGGPGPLLLSWRGCETRRISCPQVVCPLARFICWGRGQERACPAAARAAGQSAQGPGGRATRARSSPAEHSWIPDKGPRWGGGRRSVCFLPAGSVPATLGFSKSLAQGVWLSQTTLLVFYLSLAPVQSLSPYPEGDFGSR